MSLSAFLNAIQESARVTVPPPSASGAAALDDAGEALARMDEAARAEMAFVPPPLLMPVAAWAAARLYRACQYLAYREAGADQVRAGLAEPCPAAEPASPGACYSADLALRYLPDVVALARGIATEDPLVEGLIALARQWPLSSVGVSGLGEVDVCAFVGDPSLRRLYADRVIERADLSRLGDAVTRAAVREALGGFPQLAPAVAAALETYDAPACVRTSGASR